MAHCRMNAWSIVLFGIIGILLAMALVIFIPNTCTVERVEEGFQQDIIKTCPRGSIMFTDTAGNINCCRGDVTGSRCDGRVICTFSSDTSKYPMCNAPKLKRQYTGEIPEWLNVWVEQRREPLYDVLKMMEEFSPIIKQIPNTFLPDSVKNSYFELLKEQNARGQQLLQIYFYSKYDASLRDSMILEWREYQKEDIMYIINKLTTMMTRAPKLQSSPIVQQQIKAQICK